MVRQRSAKPRFGGSIPPAASSFSRLLVVLLATLGVGAAPASPQSLDIEALRSARGRFDAAVPTPESVFGFHPGADFQLADWAAIRTYLRALDEASDRIEIDEIGTSTLGQPMLLAMISAPENLRERERYRHIAERLARGRIDATEAAALAAEGKTIVWIDSGLHASEVAHGQHAPELAWMLVAGQGEEFERWRRDTIVLLMPNMNPDGLDRVVDWYRGNLGTPFETADLPVLYHEYVGHDNNRDWYMMTQAETRAVARQLYEVWYPQIVYNHHQSAPFPARIFVPPFDDPSNPSIPPLVLRGIERVGNAITSRLEAEGKPGAISRIGFDAWWNGGMRTAPYFHNQVGILTETALFRYATPNFYPPRDLPQTFRDGTSTFEPSVKYPQPWRGGWWRLRDPLEYMLTASMATIDTASRHRDQWLLNMWRMASEAIAAGESGSPAAWVVPAVQRDPGVAAEMVEVLRLGGLEIHQADTEVEIEGRSYAAGSWVIPAAQAFRAYAIDLLEPQVYPDRRLYPGGPPDPPYDVSGWTLPLQMGVDVDRVEAAFTASLEPVREPVARRGGIRGRGSVYALDPRLNGSVLTINRALASGAEVTRLLEPVTLGDGPLPSGVAIVEGLDAELAAQLAADSGSDIRALETRPPGGALRLRAPRVGVYEPWVANMDAGWTRFLLERFAFQHRVLRDADVRKGSLHDLVDVVILPSASARTLREGHAPGTMPARYTGGLGAAGIEALREFVHRGGTLVALDAATALPIEEFGLPLERPLAGLAQSEFYCPGALLRIDVDPSNPLAWGMPERATAFFVDSTAFRLPEAADPAATAQLPVRYARDGLLESGWILGAERLQGLGAVANVPLGEGRVVLLGFRTQFRAQPHETFKLLFNALYSSVASTVAVP